MRLFLANIPHQLTEAELNQLLTQYGQVISLKLVNDPQTGKRKGFGFVEMRDRTQAQKAIDALNGLELHGRKLSVKEATEKDTPAGDNQENRYKRQRINREPENSPGEIDGNRW
jgi:RNA recognition motif-containing protein